MSIYKTLTTILILTAFDVLETALPPADSFTPCGNDGWDINIDVTTFGHGVTPSTSSDVHLGRAKCTGVFVQSHILKFHYPYDSCGSQVQTLPDKVMISNVLYLAKINRTEWIIPLTCIFPRDQKATAFYKNESNVKETTTSHPSSTTTSKQPVRSTPSTETSPRVTSAREMSSTHSNTARPHHANHRHSTMKAGMTTTPMVSRVPAHHDRETSTVPSTTDKPHPTTAAPVKPVHCHVCSGGTCGVLPMMEHNRLCPASHPFCMSSVTNNANGMKTYVKKCASQHDCESLWWQTTSDLDVCVKFKPVQPYQQHFECHYCCIKDNCNSNVYPNKATLYKGKS